MNKLVTSSLSRLFWPLYNTHGIDIIFWKTLFSDKYDFNRFIDNVEWIAHQPSWTFPNDNLWGNIFFVPWTKIIFSFIGIEFFQPTHKPGSQNSTFGHDAKDDITANPALYTYSKYQVFYLLNCYQLLVDSYIFEMIIYWLLLLIGITVVSRGHSP